MNVTKRDGSLEPLALDKIYQVIKWACEDLDNVSISEIELKARLQMYEGISTTSIHELVVKAASELISVEYPNYQYVAARLDIFHLYKQVYLSSTPPSLVDYIPKMVEAKLYDNDLSSKFCVEDLLELEELIDHSKDLKFVFVAMGQWRGKYLVKHRVTGELYETPQMAYMAMSMTFFQDEAKEVRLDLIKEAYTLFSDGVISLPTPIMGGLRTPTRQFSSCVLIEADDSLDSINATSNAIIKYVSQRAGIGVNIGNIRAEGSEIRGGEASHTGMIPFIKHFQSAVKSCSQGSLRGGAATAFYPLWHLEVESLLVLKNNRGVEENRARQLDYAVQLNKLMYERVLTDGYITLFSPSDVPGLYKAFFANQAEFARLYTMYEADPTIRKSRVKAIDLFSSLLQERAQTGRIYIHNVDHTNTNGPFEPSLAPIRQMNLCVAGNTKLLTKEGYAPIESISGTTQTVWNGSEWSENVEIVQTSPGQPVVDVEFSDFTTITATPYHKWYIQDGYGEYNIKEVRTSELKPGDKIVKHKLSPVDHGTKLLSLPYENGFFTGDGSMDGGTSIIYLYDDKKILLPRLSGYSKYSTNKANTNGSRTIVRYKKGVLKPKYFVPDSSYSVHSRLAWLAGYLDADGCVTNNNGTESIQAGCTNLKFLHSVKYLLEELGVHSTVTKGADEGYKKLPANNGTGELKEYWCNTLYRLLIAGSGLSKLLKLGFLPSRLVVSDRPYQREARHFIRVIKVIDNKEAVPTFCATEPKRNKLVFNGILTGNCLEASLPTDPIPFPGSKDGEIALCTLAAFNLGIDGIEDKLERAAYIIVRALDNLLDYQDYPVHAAEKTKKRRTLGVGVTSFAYYLAKNGKYYSNGSANNLTHRLFEAIQFHLLSASCKLAEEKGCCEYFDDTSYSSGKLPMDRYKRTVDDLHTESYHMDWEALRMGINEYGLRNSTLTALMPCETSSQITNSTNGMEPPRGLLSVKGSKDRPSNQIVPGIGEVNYELLWDIPDNKGYLELIAIAQKFVDQGASANTNYDPSKFVGGKVPMMKLLEDLMYAYKLGLKSLYYHNTRDGASDDIEEEDNCLGGACKL